MDGAGVEELRLAFARTVVEVGNHNFATTGQRAERDDFALVGMVGGKLEHHFLVGRVGRVTVPIIFGAVAAVPHRDFLHQRRRRLQRCFIAKLLEIGKFLVVGVCRNHLAINTVNRNGLGNGVQVIVAAQVEGEIILIAFLHELVQFLLALLGKNVAANHCGQNQHKIA